MKIKVKTSGEMLMVSLEGELDHHTAKIFKARVQQKVETGDIKYLVIDMCRLSFMDSSGIGAILGRLNQLKKKDGKVVVLGCSHR